MAFSAFAELRSERDKALLEEILRFDGNDDNDDTTRLDDDDDTIRPDHVDDAARHAEAIQLENAPDAPVVTLPDFARLVPLNDPAKLAFHEIALILKTNSEWNPHCRKFIHVSDFMSKLISGPSMESDTSEGDMEIQEVYTGHFRLNLDILPDNFAMGVVIGAGRLNLEHLGVDILLTTKGHRDDVRGRHASIRHHHLNRLLMIVPARGKTVILNGEEVSREGRVLESTRMGLTVGKLAYRIEFLPMNAGVYQERLEEIVRESGSFFTERIESIDLTPSESHLILKGYQIQTPQAAGTFGVVSPCIKTSANVDSANVYAAKRIQRTQSSFNQVGEEVAILKKLGEHPHIWALVDVIHSDGDDKSMGNRYVNDIYLILEHWAPRTLVSLMDSQEDPSVRRQAFHQGAQGIRHIHSLHVIHRDIKPSNILVVRLNPLLVVIADFGHATTTKKSRDHMKGTISYLPPEIIELKQKSKDRKAISPDSKLHWSSRSDVYSYGLVGVELLHGYSKRPKTRIDRISHNSLLATLRLHNTAMDEILEGMLAWDPGLRPEMRDVLLKACWSELETPSSAKKRHFPA
ncbi:hypothetical protein H2200_007530 [Cladophialophora chaetospira]|uniref:Protein kinase domain-containing protein n=1 Tax=Cladophialophora chaetospira TaxID=386627 RepID=A0AA38X7Y8_9EURO|nr:hypothetical protein H2200_007530 [Cladophialophora chaetospira]